MTNISPSDPIQFLFLGDKKRGYGHDLSPDADTSIYMDFIWERAIHSRDGKGYNYNISCLPLKSYYRLQVDRKMLSAAIDLNGLRLKVHLHSSRTMIVRPILFPSESPGS